MTPKHDIEEDMSMEEILASIRKYVTDEQSPASVKSEEKAKLGVVNQLSNQPSMPELKDLAFMQSGEGEQTLEKKAEVPLFELTQDHIYDTKTSSAPSLQGQSGARYNTMQDIPGNSQFHEPSAFSHQALIHKDKTMSGPSSLQQNTASIESGIISKEVASASASALSRLMEVVKPHSHTIASQDTQSSGVTLDRLIADLARPMIKDWLDQNLAKIVEEKVAAEIEKITRNLR